jgi:hypothetical protein
MANTGPRNRNRPPYRRFRRQAQKKATVGGRRWWLIPAFLAVLAIVLVYMLFR